MSYLRGFRIEAQLPATAEIGSKRYGIANSEDFSLSDGQRCRCGSSLKIGQIFTLFRRQLISDFYLRVFDASLVGDPDFH